MSATRRYDDAETMLPFGEQLRDIRGTDLAVVAVYRTDDPGDTPPGPDRKREHYWVTHDGDRYYGVRRSTNVGQAGHADFENACKFLEEPDNPIYDYEHVVTRVVPVEQTPIPYKRAGERSVECPECGAWGRTHVWVLEDFIPDECPECGFRGEFDVRE